MAKKFITKYYSGGRCVWIEESPSMLKDTEIERTRKEIAGYGRGHIDAITDDSGRMITFDKNGDYLKEVE